MLAELPRARTQSLGLRGSSGSFSRAAHVAFLATLVLIFASLGCSKGDAPREVFDYPPDETPFEKTPVGRHGRLRVEGTQLLDTHGEAVQLKGVSSMWLNWENSGYSLTYEGLMWMRDNWNVSVIRAAMGVAAEPNEAAQGGYLSDRYGMEARVQRIVDNGRRLGVYVIIDWHDHYAQLHQSEAQDFFQRMARDYRDYDNVIYEVYNEPVTLARNGVGPFTWEDDIKPYHKRLVKTIRAEDPEGVIILGTPMWSQEVDVAARSPLKGDNLMYTLHFYACTHTEWLRERARAALDDGLPLFVTEWGATDASGGTTDKTVCVNEADEWLSLMDEYSVSWAAWKLDDCSDASCFFRSGAPIRGPFDGHLQGHGEYVVAALKGEPYVREEDARTDAGRSDAGWVADASAAEDAGEPDGSTASDPADAGGPSP